MRYIKRFNEDNITTGSVLGMGNTVVPNATGGIGSGDTFSTSKYTRDLKKNKKNKKRNSVKPTEYIMKLENFIKL